MSFDQTFTQEVQRIRQDAYFSVNKAEYMAYCVTWRISEKWSGKVAEGKGGKGRGFISSIMLAFAWNDWRNPRKSPVTITDLGAGFESPPPPPVWRPRGARSYHYPLNVCHRRRNLGRQVVRATKFCTVASNICRSSVSNSLHVTLLLPRIFGAVSRFLENLSTPDALRSNNAQEMVHLHAWTEKCPAYVAVVLT